MKLSSRISKKICYLLIVIMLVLTLVYEQGFVTQVKAQTGWEDSLSLYKDITTKSFSMREVVNTNSFWTNVNISFTNATNVNFIKSYILSGNGTTYVTIVDGNVTDSWTIYYTLKENEKLVFDVEAKPTNDIDTQTVEINIRIDMRCTSDANEDNDINVLDFIIVGNAKDSEPDDPNWDIRADRNGDLKINVLDFILVGKYLGW